MKRLEAVDGPFAVLENGCGLQTAVMRLDPGEESGPLGNEHPTSEQVVFVVEGELRAELDGRSCTMRSGDSVIVERGAPHRFVNASASRAVTFNVYAPKAY